MVLHPADDLKGYSIVPHNVHVPSQSSPRLLTCLRRHPQKVQSTRKCSEETKNPKPDKRTQNSNKTKKQSIMLAKPDVLLRISKEQVVLYQLICHVCDIIQAVDACEKTESGKLIE